MSHTLTHGTAAQGTGSDRCVLVVAAPARAEAIVRVVQQGVAAAQTHVVNDYLLALGHVAHDPPAVLIGSLDAMEDPIESTVSAFRGIAPHMRLVAVTEAEHQPQAQRAVEAGFDAYLLEPIDAGELAKALERLSDGACSAGGPTAPSAAAVLHDELGVRGDAPVAAANGDLGDVDLVRQLIGDHHKLSELAVQLVADKSGIEGVDLTDAANGVPAGHASVPIQIDDRTIGHLHAPPPATEPNLEPWARWLAEWLGLQRYVGRLTDMALRDELTGVWNRRYFNRFLTRMLRLAAHQRFRVTLLVFDIDDFKVYNDHYGHAAGDDILREAARLMQSVVRDHDVVARIGGDEFAVIFWDADAPRQPNSEHPMTVRTAAKRFQRAICSHRFPKLFDEAPGTLTISGGLAGFPWDGRTPDELLAKADQMALQSKREGKNAITFGPGAMRVCDADGA